jgi:DNA-binding SARP family transcriptional activator
MAGRLQVCLFGRFEVRRGGQVLDGVGVPKVQQMFCYLLLYRDRPHPREALAHLLWDDDHTDQPNRCLRKTLWQLRTALDAPSETLDEPLLWVDPEWVQINPQATLWLDTAVFEQAFNQTRGVPGRALDVASAQALKRALDLYRGGLQESWYQDWYLYERERFRHMYLILLDKLMGYDEAQHSYEEGLAYGTLILRCDQASERTHRRLMRLYYLAGDRTAALRQYERCARALAEELGVEPAQSTVALYQRIRADRLAPPVLPPTQSAGPVRTTASPLPVLLQRLRRLEQALIELEHEVRQDISTVWLSMNGQG